MVRLDYAPPSSATLSCTKKALKRWPDLQSGRVWMDRPHLFTPMGRTSGRAPIPIAGTVAT